jgi:2-polyprenyl-3-methyl-5-hydroxy-6-metoxy-1,4-benzoquinol methylase
MCQTKIAGALMAASTEEFAGRLLNVFNHGALCFMLSIGHRTGLFDAMRDQHAQTSAEIAALAKLHERYVREWLGAMTTSGIVKYEPELKTYQLPAEHAAALTRAAGAGNISVIAQYFAVMGSVEDEIVDCFRQGGGVPYSKFTRFHEVMAEDSGQSVLSSLEGDILPLVPGLRAQSEAGIRALDVGCGRGRIFTKLAEMFPKSQFMGIDLSADAIAYARNVAHSRGLKNIEFVQADVSDFDEWAEPAAFDLVATFDAIHDQAKPLNVLRGIHRALKADGVYLMQEINGTSHVDRDIEHPIGTLMYTISCMHCMTVSLAQGGEGLGAMWGEERTRDYATRAGFTSIVANHLAHDIQNNWYVVRKS